MMKLPDFSSLFKRKSALVGMGILGFLLFIAVFAPLLAPYDPIQVLIGVEPVKVRQAPCIHLGDQHTTALVEAEFFSQARRQVLDIDPQLQVGFALW